MKCSNCGKTIGNSMAVCPYCGAKCGYRNRPAVVGMAVGMIAMVLSLLVLPSIAAIILSAVGYRNAKSHHNIGKGNAELGLILGGISLGFAALIWGLIIFG